MSQGLPDADLVRRLVDEQCPELAGAVSVFAQGWDNTVFALGEDYLVRMPCREIGAALLAGEQWALPPIAAVLRESGIQIELPIPVYCGIPSKEYPWRWSVVPRLAGRVAYSLPAPQREPAARLLAATLATLHAGGDALNAPVNSFRNGHIGDLPTPGLAPVTGETYAGIEPASVLQAWRAWSSAPRWARDPVAIHGDVHAGNVLCDPVALIDWGDTTAGDPAVDLAAAWTVFEGPGAAAFVDEATRRAGYGEATWHRARAWALRTAVLIAGGPDTPLRAESPRILRALLA